MAPSPAFTLRTKIQYKNYEPGEFADKKGRTCEETLRLIEAFPWEEQRDRLQVSLTNPSITVEGTRNDFLKLALFYNGRFVLHYFDRQHHLYTKSFATYQEACPYLKNFYTEDPFDTTDFKLEITWMQNNTIHFPDKDFHYCLTPKGVRAYLFSTSGISFLLTFFLIGMLINYGHSVLPLLLLFLPVIFLVGGGLNLLLFANYYPYAKGKILIMTRGNNIFYFGDIGQPEKFDKKRS